MSDIDTPFAVGDNVIFKSGVSDQGSSVFKIAKIYKKKVYHPVASTATIMLTTTSGTSNTVAPTTTCGINGHWVCFDSAQKPKSE